VAAWRIEEEGAKAASHLLQVFIRALDYLPPVHVEFPDFLSAVLTADWQICPADQPYQYRKALRDAFYAFGIKPAAKGILEPGIWDMIKDDREIRFSSGNMDTMHWNPESIFKLLWEKYEVLGLQRDVFTRINSVRPVWRVGPSGFVLRETVAEYYQLNKTADIGDLKKLKIKVPDFLADGQTVELVGGGTLIFDEFGRLKFHIHNRISNANAQHRRLISLWQRGGLRLSDRKPWRARSRERRFASLHARRANGEPTFRDEGWD
jgi:hypothetical protein